MTEPVTVQLPKEDWIFLSWIVRSSTTNLAALRIIDSVLQQATHDPAR